MAPVTQQQSAMDDTYHLLYWPGIPGRGEHIRLVLEEAGAKYTDSAFAGGGIDEVLAFVQAKVPDDGINPQPFAPPILKHKDLVISQTPNILQYLGTRLGLVPNADNDPNSVFKVNALALTALDGLSNEPHDCHHPVATGLYYEDQKEESKRRSEDYVKNRLPKFLSHFERVLGSQWSGSGPWLSGSALSYADLVVFQCVDGVKFMFPKAMARLEREGKHAKVFALHKAVSERPRIKAYLESPRRQKYSLGIYRYYEELDNET
ncbi:glutathione S-transferase [Parathielavia hyrcaniae]|uniref:Glutathione S-transferase n=1 Tax=Parathielavia hyrcaniae TaxID=113614 RepID=A0AAN6SXQ5_9PEZI|nr:glutathione S-transferase [Parathielavia hyrcaniae]